jgi:NADPH-dependent 2,4-dienoyl-CoA reductase/sulfur reductase-like enzyme
MSNAPRSVLIVGASLAGHATATALRDRGFDGPITIVGDEAARPYDRPPLSKEFLAGAVTETDLALEADGEDLEAHWLLGATAVALDPVSRTVTLADGGRLRADAVVVATGSRARRLPGAPPGVHTVRTVQDAVALRAELLPGARLAVIGAGFIGAEIASTARSLGLRVTVIEAAATPLAGPLGPQVGRAVAGLHEANGVRLRCGVPVAGLSGTQRVTGVRLADGAEVPADVVVAGIGAEPAVRWLAGSGLDISGGLRCDAAGGTDAPGVFGVGDCSAWYDEARGRHHRVEHWTDSRERPVIAVATLLGATDRPTPPGRPPYFWSDQYGVRLQFAGHRFGDEEISIEAGSLAGADALVLYRRGAQVVAVLGMNQPKLFTRWRRSLSAPARPTVSAGAVPASVSPE